MGLRHSQVEAGLSEMTGNFLCLHHDFTIRLFRLEQGLAMQLRIEADMLCFFVCFPTDITTYTQ